MKIAPQPAAEATSPAAAPPARKLRKMVAGNKPARKQPDVRVRMEVKRVHDIDLVAQTFKAHWLLEASWVDPAMVSIDFEAHPWEYYDGVCSDQKQGILRLKDLPEQQFFAPRLICRNVGELQEEEMWYNIYENRTDKEAGPIVCLRWEVIGSFITIFQLARFPFDRQELKIRITSGHEDMLLQKNQSGSYRSYCNREHFAFASEYILSERVHFFEGRTKPFESSNFLSYPQLVISLSVDRLASYWLLNVVLPMAIITGCSFASYVVPTSDLADRCSITLTMLLAQVAYKYLVAEKLPTIGYATIIDVYVLFCFLVTFALTTLQAYSAMGLYVEPSFEYNATRRDGTHEVVSVPTIPVALFLVWFGAHVVLWALCVGFKAFVRLTDHVWSSEDTASKCAVWIGPLSPEADDQTVLGFLSADFGGLLSADWRPISKDWDDGLDSRSLVHDVLRSFKALPVGLLKAALPMGDAAADGSASASLPRPQHVRVWSPAVANHALRSAGFTMTCNNYFAIAVYSDPDAAFDAADAWRQTKLGAASAEAVAISWALPGSINKNQLKMEGLNPEWAPLTNPRTYERGRRRVTGRVSD